MLHIAYRNRRAAPLTRAFRNIEEDGGRNHAALPLRRR
jgi:hypothetical protein